jgi:hypothetical protein
MVLPRFAGDCWQRESDCLRVGLGVRLFPEAK